MFYFRFFLPHFVYIYTETREYMENTDNYAIWTCYTSTRQQKKQLYIY